MDSQSVLGSRGPIELQYSGLDEEQMRVKLSQLPRGSKLYFQTYTAEQMSNPVSMEKQQALLQGLRKSRQCDQTFHVPQSGRWEYSNAARVGLGHCSRGARGTQGDSQLPWDFQRAESG